MGRMHGILMAMVLALAVAGSPGTAWAKGKKAAARATAKEAPKKLNACGCYADTSGKCICTRRGKCGCPGECEPKGCEEKRARQMAKEIAAETKKAKEADRKARLNESKQPAQPEDKYKPKPKPVDRSGVGQ
ncbi:MAG: hypothetical protein JXP73_21595 [Deltaproteobacteria bacterium]|nr:hypothetical protein [Deltaproteobacteria bacterium]